MSEVFTEFFGFFIFLAILIFSWVRSWREQLDRQKHPEKYKLQEEREQAEMRKLLKELNMEADIPLPPPPPEDRAPPPPPPLRNLPRREVQRVSGDYKFSSNIAQREHDSRIDDRHVEVHIDQASAAELGMLEIRDNPEQNAYAVEEDPYENNKYVRASRAHKLMKGLSEKRDLVLFAEIFGKPKGLE